MSDDGSQETQLRGKQLVFLGMSVTVVAVVIFLCGVMVGRGVPTARQVSAPAIEADPATDLTGAEGGDIADLEPVPSVRAGGTAPLEYPVIVSDQPGADSLVTTTEPRQPFTAETAVATVTPAKPEPANLAPTPTPTTPKSSAPAAAPPRASTAAGSGGFLVQVAAYQSEADAAKVSDRLKKKGYPAFVTTATTAAGTWFRVRVGSFDTRAEAQSMATRLKREEQLEPWVTR